MQYHFRGSELRTLNISRQVVKDKGPYTKNRLQVPLPKVAPYTRYKVILDDKGRMGIIYGRDVSPEEIQSLMVSISPVGASVGAVLGSLNQHQIEPLYLGLTGSVTTNDYSPLSSDVDMLLVVPDDALNETKPLMQKLQPNIDVICVSKSDAMNLGLGVGHVVMSSARAIVDKIGLTEVLKGRAIDWTEVKQILAAELDLLSSYRDNVLVLSRNKSDRIECATHIWPRLRAVYLVDCLLHKSQPQKKELAATLTKHGISASVLRKLYLSSRMHEKGMPIARTPVLDKKVLLRICEAIHAYGKEVQNRIGQ